MRPHPHRPGSWPTAALLLAASLLPPGCGSARAQSNYATPYTFATVAGSPLGAGSADGTGGGARFNGPWGVAVDSVGTLYVTDTFDDTIRKVTGGGVVTTLAGLAGAAGSADGAGAGARLDGPSGGALDSAGTLYFADSMSSTIRRVDSGGVVTTVAGLAGCPGSADGTGSDARFCHPIAVAVDGAGTVYVADSSNSTIRRITNGVVTTLAGSARSFGSADGTGGAARFWGPQGIAVNGAGMVYVADTGNCTIRRITPGGVVTTLAGAPTPGGPVSGTAPADGTGSAATFGYTRGVAVDASGNLYVADSGYGLIRRVTPGGVVTTLAGLAGAAGTADGTGSAAHFMEPFGVAVDRRGTVYVSDALAQTIRIGVPLQDDAPVVTKAPSGASVIQGSPVRLCAAGYSPLTYQWCLNGVPIPGATSSSLTVASPQPANAGSYTCVVTNAAGSATSSIATLEVH